VTASHLFPVRVYYEDTDFSGNVYHAAYLHFLERGRTEFLRDVGVHHSELLKEGIAFAVRSMEIEFVRAAHIDDELVVDTSLIEMTGARFTLDQSIERGDELVARAKVVAVAIKTDGKPTRLPRSLVAALSI
jgi:acyl-CoA thioester hydrolase